MTERRRGGRVAEGGGLLNRYRGLNPYRGFESPSLRQIWKSLGKFDISGAFLIWKPNFRQADNRVEERSIRCWKNLIPSLDQYRLNRPASRVPTTRLLKDSSIVPRHHRAAMVLQ